jgi:hypothetical protein
LYVAARNKLENNIQLINIPFVLNVLLYDDEGESYETNSHVFLYLLKLHMLQGKKKLIEIKERRK